MKHDDSYKAALQYIENAKEQLSKQGETSIAAIVDGFDHAITIIEA